MITGKDPMNPIYDEGYLKPSRNDEMGLKWMEVNKPFIGLTIRQHFSAMAMQGILSNHTMTNDVSALIKEGSINAEFGKEIFAFIAVQAADALIDELNKTEK